MSRVNTFEAFGGIDERFIREAETARAAKWPRVLTVAACVAVMAVTLSFATGLWTIEPPVTVAPHLCSGTDIAMEEEFSLVLRLKNRLQYGGRQYGYCAIERNENSLCTAERLTAIDSTTDCPFCDPVKDAELHRVSGELYAVEGLSSEHAVCLVIDGEKTLYTVEEASFASGAALFSEALHLREKAGRLGVLTNAQWEKSEQQDMVMLSADDDAVSAFLQVLDHGVPVQDVDWQSAEKRYHVYWQLDNGVDVHVRLYENGLVAWENYVFDVDNAALDAFAAYLDGLTGAE